MHKNEAKFGFTHGHLLTWRGVVYDLYCSQTSGGAQDVLASLLRSGHVHFYFLKNGCELAKL